MSLDANDIKGGKEKREKEREKNEHVTLNERHEAFDHLSQNRTTNHEEQGCQKERRCQEEKEENTKQKE